MARLYYTTRRTVSSWHVFPRSTLGCLSDGPGRHTAVVRQPSLFTHGAAWRAKNTLVCTWTRCRDRAGVRRASGSTAGVHHLGLRDPERPPRRSWTTAASPPAPPVPRQATSRLIPTASADGT